MPQTSAGGHTGTSQHDPDERNSYRIQLYGSSCYIEDRPIENFGITRDRAKEFDKACIDGLSTLSGKIRDKEQDTSIGADSETQRLEAAITLDKIEYQRELQALREIGKGLRGEFSTAFQDELNGVDFPSSNRDIEPGFIFTERLKNPPIFWEMLYELGNEKTSLAQAENFWGLRIPISHWLAQNRPQKIKLDQGLFWATHRSLELTGQHPGSHFPQEIQEIATYLRQFQFKKSPYCMREAFKTRITEELKGKEQDIAEWLRNNFPYYWFPPLFHILQDEWAAKKYGNDELLTRGIWIEEVLRDLFIGPDFSYDLLHFACHCTTTGIPGEGSQIEMTVGEEMIPLKASLIHDKLCKRDGKPKSEERDEKPKKPVVHLWEPGIPGPLVFLNACSTMWNPAAEVLPAFPQNWIDCRGAQAVITTICPVPIYFSYKFAEKFYEILFDAVSKYPRLLCGENFTKTEQRDIYRNRYLAEALLATKQFFLKQYRNPLGLAYMLYAPKDSHVSADIRQNIQEVTHA